jgi:hypothetical protein
LKPLLKICGAGLLCSVVLFTCLYTSCKDPNDFEPEFDSLIPPPDPPELLSPENGYVFMRLGCYVRLEWAEIEQANLYFVEYQIDTFPAYVKQRDSTFYDVIMDEYRYGIHTWRVKASSPYWEWMTDYSELWQFELRPWPPGPELISPEHNEIIYVDSFYSPVELVWDTVQDEEFYEYQVFKDTVLYAMDIVYANTCQIYIDDTTHYKWKVRCGSSKWEVDSRWSDTRFFHIRFNN